MDSAELLVSIVTFELVSLILGGVSEILFCSDSFSILSGEFSIISSEFSIDSSVISGAFSKFSGISKGISSRISCCSFSTSNPINLIKLPRIFEFARLI